MRLPLSHQQDSPTLSYISYAERLNCYLFRRCRPYDRKGVNESSRTPATDLFGPPHTDAGWMHRLLPSYPIHFFFRTPRPTYRLVHSDHGITTPRGQTGCSTILRLRSTSPTSRQPELRRSHALNAFDGSFRRRYSTGHSIMDIMAHRSISDKDYDARSEDDLLKAFPVSQTWLLKNYGTVRPGCKMNRRNQKFTLRGVDHGLCPHRRHRVLFDRFGFSRFCLNSFVRLLIKVGHPFQ